MKSFSLNIPISKVDEEQRIVYGYATKEELDRQGDIVDYEASKKAFKGWAGNIREQHDGKKAVGKRVSMEFNDAEKSVLVGAYISRSTDGENALTKVKEGILTGFSIGGKIFKTVKETIKGLDGEESANRITDYELSELSLVDVPACPSAQFMMVKSADGKVKEVEEMHEASIQPWFFKHYAFSPTQQVNQLRKASDNKNMNTKEQTMSDDINKATTVHAGEARDADAEPVTPEINGKTPKQAEAHVKDQGQPNTDALAITPVPNTSTEVNVGGKKTTNDDKNSDAVAIPPTPNTTTETPKKKAVESEMKKGLYTVSQLADCVSNLTWIVSDTEWEAQFEGEKSAAVGELKAAVTAVGNALVSLTQEAVADLEMSDNPTDLKKMVTDTLKSTQDEMLKAFKSEMAGIVTASMKPLEDRLNAIESQPAGNAPVREYSVVDKVADGDEPDELTQLMTKQADVIANPNKYGSSERSKLMTDLMIAKSRQRPVTINQ